MVQTGTCSNGIDGWLVGFAKRRISTVKRSKSRLSRQSCLVVLLSFSARLTPGSGQPPLCRQGGGLPWTRFKDSPDTRMRVRGVRAARCLNDGFKCPGMGQKESMVVSGIDSANRSAADCNSISSLGHDLLPSLPPACLPASLPLSLSLSLCPSLHEVRRQKKSLRSCPRMHL